MTGYWEKRRRDEAIVEECKKQGWTVAELAALFKVSIRTIQRALKEVSDDKGRPKASRGDCARAPVR